ncbi:hypothetical protein NA57DRAFT_73770 [Rhizodiscina lignyota]|uniref:Uncharacterized protein n=1 Tax=Rhizodiscina lignyota TaxID=1504668 RepID=A0A9P4IN77_9PEZI|nr:hypothetical protein NA57DRAFT_73770 [Rhizodiscina lignyota]
MAPTPSIPSLQNLQKNILHLPREILAHLEHLSPRDAPAESLPSHTLSAVKRQYTTVAIPATYQGLNAGPAPGTVVGIVLGSVAGFVLVIWLLWTLANYGGRGGVTAESIQVVREGRSRSPHSHSRRSRRSHHRTVTEVRERSRSPLPPPRNETIIVEERRSAPPPMERETSIVEERRTEPRVEGDDIVEVIEEGSLSVSPGPPPRRDGSRRSRRSGFRQVDPNQFGGGDYPQQRIRRDRSLSSRG